jgi:FKBP-type peptidyl-prolyl cis-trans isomerase
MKTFLHTALVAAGLGMGLAALAAPPDEKPASEKPAGTFKDDKEKASYGIGLFFGNQIKKGNLEVDMDVVISALKDVLSGGAVKLTDQQASEAIRSYQRENQLKAAEKNKKEGEGFLSANKSKPGVKTQTVSVNGTNVEMQYKILTEGKGEIPKSNDIVKVNYRGTLISGKEFDSTAKHGGTPLSRPANSLIKGWTEALQMMKVGSKWEIYLPSALAYGDNAAGPEIPPGATLIFEMELLGIEPPAAPAPPPQPLTSDIIRVPSADELKKGAKIEVLKPEDVEKAKKEAEQQGKKP